MTATPKVLVAAQDLANASATLYTSPANGKGTWIDHATVTEHAAATQAVTFNIVPNGGSTANTNIVVNAKSLASKATDLLPEMVGRFLNPGDFITGFAGNATAVSVGINGREIT